MYEWDFTVQAMIDEIERQGKDGWQTLTLESVSRQVGYSKFYCSRQFQKILGLSFRRYVAGRRLCAATIRIRDTREPISQIALENGYSSQGALTRAFKEAYGCTPAAYRKDPRPIPMSIQKAVLKPLHFMNKGVFEMKGTEVTTPAVWVEYIPEHDFIGLYDLSAKGYTDFERRGDFDRIEGILESMVPFQHPVVWSHHAGWFYENGQKGYFYGTGVFTDYAGEVPEGFVRRHVPAGYYLVFGHPKYDYYRDNGEVMKRVEELAWSFDPTPLGLRWNEEACPCYQRHYPEGLGYQVLRPVIRIA